jgi:hypothetical protein
VGAGEDRNKGEKTRLCPTCRMEISVLATKCRFCGESVGRPQEATRSLSINDLGGETVRHYAPSSNVMDALESFRAEETASQPPVDEKHEKSLFGRGKKHETDPKAAKSNFGLPELDAKSQDLASVSMSGSAVRKAVKKEPPKWKAWVSLALKGVAVLAVLFVGIRYGVPVVQGMFKKEVIKPVVENRAPRLMEQNKPPLDILRAAKEAVNLDNSETNQKIMSDARGRVKKAVDDLLNAPKYSKEAHKRALDIAHAASEIDPTSQEITQLKQDALEETRAYGLSFIGTEGEGENRKAKFKLTVGGQNPIVSVAKDELVDNRFKLDSFTDSGCRLADTKRGDRSVQCKVNDFPA